MKFKEMAGKGIEAVSRFGREQMEARERRLGNPRFQLELERTRNLIGNNVKEACFDFVEGFYRFTITPVVMSFVEGGKEAWAVGTHNASVDKKQDKKSYLNIPAAMIVGFLNEWRKGGISTVKMVGHLGAALGRTTILGARYTIGR